MLHNGSGMMIIHTLVVTAASRGFAEALSDEPTIPTSASGVASWRWERTRVEWLMAGQAPNKASWAHDTPGIELGHGRCQMWQAGPEWRAWHTIDTGQLWTLCWNARWKQHSGEEDESFARLGSPPARSVKRGLGLEEMKPDKPPNKLDSQWKIAQPLLTTISHYWPFLAMA